MVVPIDVDLEYRKNVISSVTSEVMEVAAKFLAFDIILSAAHNIQRLKLCAHYCISIYNLMLTIVLDVTNEQEVLFDCETRNILNSIL